MPGGVYPVLAERQAPGRQRPGRARPQCGQVAAPAPGGGGPPAPRLSPCLKLFPASGD